MRRHGRCAHLANVALGARLGVFPLERIGPQPTVTQKPGKVVHAAAAG